MEVSPPTSFAKCLIDRINRFSGGAEYSFSGEATLSSDTHRKAWSRPPIGMEFSIVMFTSSGLLVRYLKVIEKSGYRFDFFYGVC
jgi:AP-2 complex subunit mu-1